MRQRLSSLIPSDLSKRSRALLGIIFALHIAFALYFAFAIPLNNGPDEGNHIAYVKQLVVDHQLPNVVGNNMTDLRTGAIGAHPPLTYVAGIPFYIAAMGLGENAAGHSLRIEAVLWSVLTLAFIWLLLCETFPDKPAQNLAALAFAALLPEFMLMSGVWNNDGLLNLLSAAFLWLFLRLVRRESSNIKQWVWLGIIWGAVLLTKATALIFVLPVTLVLLWQGFGKKRDWKTLGTAFGAFLLPGLLIGGWWFVRSYLRTGSLQPVPDFAIYRAQLLHSPVDLLMHPDALPFMLRCFAGETRSIWGQVDWNFSPDQLQLMRQYDFWPAFWGPASPRQPALFDLTLVLYRIAVVTSLAAIAGFIARIATKRSYSGLGILTLFFGLLYASVCYYTLFKHPGFYEGGRYLLPVLAAMAMLWVSGLSFWIPENKEKWLAPALVGFFAIWNFGCAVNLVGFLVPFYAPK